VARDCGHAGRAGFTSTPRIQNPWFTGGTIEATSYYDTDAAQGNFETLIDFDRINQSTPTSSERGRYADVRSGNLTYFDPTDPHDPAGAVVASGRVAAGFPAWK